MLAQFTLHDLPMAERPRERMVEHGISALSSQEILALVLGRGVAGQPVMRLAEQLLGQFGSLQGVAEASLQDLRQVKGIGLAKAGQLQACAEMARRMGSESTKERIRVIDPKTVFKLAKKKIVHYHKEHYLLFSLDARHHLLGVDIVTIGNLDAALVHPRETFETAIKRHAAKVIVCHNHPSGTATPSDDDLVVTKRLATAGKILGINLLDHVIVTTSDYYSLQENGQL